jgi:hypothetical protein
MKYLWPSTFVALALLAIAVAPAILQGWESARLLRKLDVPGASGKSTPETTIAAGQQAGSLATPDPALLVRVEEQGRFVASWQTVGGCGAGSGGGSSIGLKWIGRNVRGGLFNVQEQMTYTKIGKPNHPDYNFFFNTLINTDLGEKWNVGVNLPFVYKWLTDPDSLGGPGVAPIDYSNSGLGDISLLCTRKLGRINATSLTATLGLPTGVYDARTTRLGTPLNQSQQIGFGEFTGGLTVDHTFDEVWGLAVVGGSASWRGGTNKIHNYRSPTATAYGYVGYFLGPLVPAVGLSISGYKDHDKDLDVVQQTPLYSFAANLSIEWSVDWIALLVAASVPYGYDGFKKNDSGLPRSPWGFFPWTVSLGIAVSPF